jgi:hypothetical protein
MSQSAPPAISIFEAGKTIGAISKKTFGSSLQKILDYWNMGRFFR